ncbi:hypothetical protein HIM_01244 [Hirsutella minnesotensis 3608]|nr:hypothetical protein HIM_01244 [Hirsutella minnesotensis 3608]
MTTLKPTDDRSSKNEPSPLIFPATNPAPPLNGGVDTIRDSLDSVGFHTDGRVRNPVPSKLQGLTNNRNGNFAVMHIDLTGTKPSDRNAAAKRTSEETEAQARRANQGGWQPVRRIKSAWHNEGSDSNTTRASQNSTPPSKGVSAAKSATFAGAAALPTTVTTPEPSSAHSLPPREIKAEQARLLTLLRTLHPVLVVDQLCKALAYFGGIPGAPPPADGIFPSSAATNGSGSLLVSWLVEIFPQVDDPAAVSRSIDLPPLPLAAVQASPAQQDAPAPQATPSEPAKRARGRPKGSKSSKVRKDKGMKKSRPPTSSATPSAPVDASLPTRADDANPPISSTNTTSDPIMQPALVSGTDPPEAAPRSQADPDSTTASTPGAKKRGRPKGSKNRPKVKADSGKKPSDPALAGQMNQNSSNACSAFQSQPVQEVSGLNQEPENSNPNHTSSNDGTAIPVSANATHVSEANSIPASYTQYPTSYPAADVQEQTVADAISNPKGLKRSAYQDGTQSMETNTGHGFSAHQNPDAASRDNIAKRRRLSKDPGHGALPDTQVVSPNLTESPVISQGLSSASPQLAAPRNFEAQNPSTSRPSSMTSVGTGHMAQTQNHQHHQHQQSLTQPPSRFYVQQSQRQSPSLSLAHPQHHGVVPASSSSTPRNQAVGFHPASRRAYPSPQMAYSPHRHLQSSATPITNQLGIASHNNVSNGRGGSDDHQGFPQSIARQGPAGPGSTELPQNRGGTAFRGRLPRHGTGQSHGFRGSHHQQPASHPTTINSFQGYNEQSYLNMDYGLTERDVQDAAAITALGSPSQLEAALSQPKLKEHIFQSIARQ